MKGIYFIQSLFYKSCPFSLLMLLSCLDTALLAQDVPERKQVSILSFDAGVQHGFIFAHSPEVENTKGSNPTGIELRVSWQRSDASMWDLCNCFPRKGLVLSYYDFDNVFLGKAVNAAYVLEPTYRLGKNMFFSFKGAAGFSYLSNPFDSIHNPGNQSYSTFLSAYLAVGTGIWVKLKEHWWLNGSINYQHVSNGGFRQPNKGVNWPTAGLAVSYLVNPRPLYTGIRNKEKFWKGQLPRFDFGLFGMAKRGLDENGNSRRLPLVGVSVQAAKQVGRISALTIGAEGYWDEALRMKLGQDNLEKSAFRAGALIGHEFLLGKFIFSQRLGVYVFQQTPYFDRLYHRWGINYRVNRNLFLGFNLNAHRQIADFIDLRLLYSIGWNK